MRKQRCSKTIIYLSALSVKGKNRKALMREYEAVFSEFPGLGCLMTYWYLGTPKSAKSKVLSHMLERMEKRHAGSKK